MILITGGAGFIGSNFILNWLKTQQEPIVNLDKLTYSGNLSNLKTIDGDFRYTFILGDICDTDLVRNLFKEYKPRGVINFAAESHVDRSISGPDTFIRTNIVGTFNLLECARNYFMELDENSKKQFRFIHVSTDEVYGSLKKDDPPFSEANQYQPNSPYSASKASADHLVRAYHHTYGLPTLTTNCSNNYGPFQFPEKLIPLVITNALAGKKLPVYGTGENIRDWLFVEDHCTAVMRVFEAGQIGGVYNIGGSNEKTNLEVVGQICSILDQLKPLKNNAKYSSQIAFVKDRPGHDRRYAIDSAKVRTQLGWVPNFDFEAGILFTVKWYLDNVEWTSEILRRQR